MTADAWDLSQYIEFCRTTAIYPDAMSGNPVELLYLSNGLVGEVLELEEVFDAPITEREISNVKAELGDVCWYAARYIDTLGQDFHHSFVSFQVRGIQDALQKMCRAAGDLCNRTKKIYRDGQCSQETTERILRDLKLILLAVSYIADQEGESLESVLVYNQAKLTKRLNENKLGGSGDNR